MEMNLQHDELMYTLLLYLGPLFILNLIDFIRKSRYYRLNDTITNGTIALGNLGFSFVLITTVAALYNFVYNNFALVKFDQYSILIFVIAFILYDFCYYWNHRFHHNISLFWVDHIVHHSSENMNFGVTIRLSYFMELSMWISFIPMALAGVSLEIFLIMSYSQMAWGFIIHTQFIKNNKWLDSILNTPSLHRVHHAKNKIYIDKNYGGILIIWDRLFGTYQRELNDESPIFGVKESFRSFSPISLNLHYLKNIGNKIIHSSSVIEIFKSIFASPSWLPNKIKFEKSIKNIQSLDRKLFNPKIVLSTKISCVIRFLLSIGIFTFLFWNFSKFGLIEFLLLSSLFFWFAHYNGNLFDGKYVTWKSEFVSQSLIVIFGFVAINSEHFNDINAFVLILSIISVVSFLLSRMQNNDVELQLNIGDTPP